MEKNNFIKYYRVFKNDTAVTQISANNFKRTADSRHDIAPPIYSLPKDGTMFYGYANKAHAMEMAKAGALKYMDLLISQGDKSNGKLIQYRNDHYDDLNNNLLDANIQKAKGEIN